MSGPELHPDVADLGFLLGSWSGGGTGRYPTIDTFSYGEEVVFAHVGKPFVSYAQRTWSVPERRPLHSETGYLRMAGPGRPELVLAQPSGVVEVHTGTLTDAVVSLSAVLVGRTPTAKEVTAVERVLRVDGDVLSYRVRMAAVGQPLQDHLEGQLHRTGVRLGT
ncbi:MAG TPA: FABP family protein [Acidimicrobiales bacterium]|nr:FABP family protein [Acidimicrobiales bacterium]